MPDPKPDVQAVPTVLALPEDELAEIDTYAVDLGLTLWPPNC